MSYAIDGLVTTERADRDAPGGESWSQWVDSVHGEFDYRVLDRDFRGTVVRQFTPAYQLVSWTSEAEHVVRDRRGIDRDPRGHYEVIAPVRGTLHVGMNDADETLRPGEMALLPIDQPFHLAHGDGIYGLMFLIPFERIDDRLASSQRRQRFLTQAGVPRLIRDLLAGLARERDHLTAAEFDALCDRAADLVCLAAVGAGEPTDRSGTAAVTDAVRGHVRAHATDELRLRDLAAAIGWSPRYIQACLAREGTTLTDLIRQQRLDLARFRLTSPRFAEESIAAVAASVGFNSPSAFSQAFRQHFGVSPRDVR